MSKYFTLLCCVSYLIIGLVYLFLGEIHVDEASYIYASKLVYQGKVPYRDFFYIQTPLYPYIYGAFQYLFDSDIMVARAVSLFWGFLTLIISISLARQWGGGIAAMIAAGLLAFNPFQIYYFSIARLYALSACLLMASIYFWAQAKEKPWLNIVSLILMSLAVGVRLTLLPGLVIIFSHLIIITRKNPVLMLIYLLIIIATLGGIFGTFFYLAGDRFIYDIIGFHLSLKTGNIWANIILKFQVLASLIKNYFLFCLLLVIVVTTYCTRSTANPLRDKERFVYRAIPWTIAILIALGHFLANFTQASYQTVIFPLAFVIVATDIANIWHGIQEPLIKRACSGVFIIACLLTVFSQGKMGLWFFQGKSPIGYISEVAKIVEENTSPGEATLSSNTPLIPLMAKRNLLPGFASLEYFPDWPTERCRKFGVVNDEILKEYIAKQQASAIIFDDFSYTMAFPSLRPVSGAKRQKIITFIEKYYYRAQVSPNIYNLQSNVYIYLPRSLED